MRVALTVSFEIDEEAWVEAYPHVDPSRIRDDVRHHLDHALRAQYVNELGIARAVVVKRPSTYRPGNPFA